MLTTIRKIFFLIDAKGRRRFLLLFASMVLSAIIDMFGIAAILPFLKLASDPDAVSDFPFLIGVFAFLGVEDPNRMVVVLGGGVLALIVTGLLVRAGSIYAMARFSHGQNHRISSRLLERYLRQPYSWFLDRHSSNLGGSLVYEVDKIIGEGLVPLVRIFSQLITLSFLIVLLIVIEPIVAISSALFLGGSYFLVYMMVRKFLGRLAKSRAESNMLRYRVSQEALGGVKEVKLLQLEDCYLERYRAASVKLAKAASSGQMIGEVPRNFLEAIAFGGIIILVTAFLISGTGSLNDNIPTLGLFAVAGLKMFPAIQSMYHSLTQLRMVGSMLDNVYRDMRETTALAPIQPADGRTRLSLHNALELRGLRFTFPGATQPILKGIDLQIFANTTVGIVGGSGAGKTTTIDLILGLLTPTSGNILVDGEPVDETNLTAWQRNIGYVPQSIFLTDDSIAANIAFGLPPEERNTAALERAARLAELHDFIMAELPQGYDTPVGERGVRLSGGQRQRIGIARALYNDPDVLIFDEATSALDNLTERTVMEAVHNLSRQKTIIMVAHRLSTVRNCDTIFLLEKGRIVGQGSYDDLVATNATFRRMAQG